MNPDRDVGNATRDAEKRQVWQRMLPYAVPEHAWSKGNTIAITWIMSVSTGPGFLLRIGIRLCVLSQLCDAGNDRINEQGVSVAFQLVTRHEASEVDADLSSIRPAIDRGLAAVV